MRYHSPLMTPEAAPAMDEARGHFQMDLIRGKGRPRRWWARNQVAAHGFEQEETPTRRTSRKRQEEKRS